MINNERTRQENVDVTEYLTRIGLIEALDEFLAQERVQDLVHNAFTAKVKELEALPENAPEKIKAKMTELVAAFAEGEELTKRNIFGCFKQEIGSILYALEEYVPLAATVQTFKDNLNSETGLIDKIEEAIVEELGSLEENFKAWMFPRLLSEVESGADFEEVLKAVFGDDLPKDVLGIGIIIDGCGFGDDDDDDEDGEDGEEHECTCEGGCGCNHEDGHECQCHKNHEGGCGCDHE